VLVTGTVPRVRRARRVVLQTRRAARWLVLGRSIVSRRRFRIAFTAPSADAVLVVRAVVHRRRHRALVSPSRTIVVRVAHAPRAPAGVAVAAWGNNNHRQLGAGFKNPFSALPVSALEIGGVRAVVATYFSSYALLEDGTVRSWGGNTFGQLGFGARGQPSIGPMHVAGLAGVTAIAASGTHVMALLSNGTVATWGGNSFGQMGNGTTFHGTEGSGSFVPQIVPGLTGVVSIAAGGADDAALLSNGTVVAWGENKQGQLGDGTTVEKTVPTPVSGLSGVKAIALGGISSLGGHMLALLGDGTVRAIGGNPSGQLGDGTTTNRSSPVVVRGLSGVTAIAASVSHSMARLQNGTVVTWGNNAYGELGTGVGPETCGSERVACGRAPVPVGLSNVEAVSAGFRFSLALSAGRVSAWGLNDTGQLGDGTTTDSAVPVPVSNLADVAAISAGEAHSLALLGAAGPAPVFAVVAGHGSLTVSWEAPPTSEPWSVSWRPMAHPALKWAPFVRLDPAARTYAVTGLAAQPYEVVVRNKALGAKIVTGTPLP
jgi:alpha-tubulin suppressor-like RCC1 family protein